MATEKIDTLIVGGGQAGLALSEHLGNRGISHLVLERQPDRRALADGEVGFAGRQWTCLARPVFPSMTFPDISPDAFATKDQVVDYFEAYARQIDCPIRCGVDVKSVTKLAGRRAFRIETSQGCDRSGPMWLRQTGPFQRPIFPALVPQDAPVMQIHSNSYHNPQQLPAGSVLVVGAGSSGGQIADELPACGPTGPSFGGTCMTARHAAIGDGILCGGLAFWQVGSGGKGAVDPGNELVTISVSGAHGGQTVDFRRYAARGMNLLGLTESYADGVLHFSDDLGRNIAQGDGQLSVGARRG